MAADDATNFVRVLEVGETADSLYLVMEYVDGATLDQYLRTRGPLDSAEALACIAQAAQGLAVAHRHGIVHRDIKPQNLMLTRGAIEIMDFGIAREETGGTLTGMGLLVGTAAYPAPEQAPGSVRRRRAISLRWGWCFTSS